MKRVLICMMMVLSLLAACLAVPVSAQGASGSCGEGVNWSYDARIKTLTISGTGEMKDYPYSAIKESLHPWYDYRDEITTIVIQSGVTYIGECTFYQCPKLTKVTIADSVTRIGDNAFSDCTGLKEISIPDSVIEIGGCVFQDCTALEDVRLPENLTALPIRLFYNCQSLEGIDLPKGLQTIGAHAFDGCVALKEIEIPEGVTAINDSAFNDCRKLMKIEVPAAVERVGMGAFNNCSGLLHIVFMGSAPESVRSIFFMVQASAYYDENDSSWTDSVRDSCGGDMTWVPVADPGQVELPEIGGVLSGTCGDSAKWKLNNGVLTISGTGNVNKVPWMGYVKDITCAVIENGITSIPDSAFFGCSNMTQVSIPSSVKSMGSHVFRGCAKLKEVTLPDGLTEIPEYQFYGCESLCKIYVPSTVKTIGEYAFTGCKALATLPLHDGVESVGAYAYARCENVSEVVIPQSVKKIDTYAFGYCSALKEIYFSGDAPEIGSYAFCKVTGFAHYPANNSTWNEDTKRSYGGDLFWSEGDSSTEGACGENLRWKYENGTLTISGTGKMADYTTDTVAPWRSRCGEVKKVVVSDGVTTIGRAAFKDMYALQTVILPDSVVEIGEHAFVACTALTEVTLPDGLKTISGLCFGSCAALKNVVIPETVTEIEKNAFFACESLTNLVIPKNVKKIGDSIFGGCTSLKTVTFTGDAPEIHGCAFEEMTLTAYYPAANQSWSGDVLKNYSGYLTWVAKCIPDHQLGGWMQVAAPTEEVNGVEKRLCSICGYEETRDIAKLPVQQPTEDPTVEPTEDPAVEPSDPADSTGPAGSEATEPAETIPDQTEPAESTPDTTGPTENVPDPTEPEKPDKKANGVNDIVITSLVVAGLLGIVAAIFFVLRKRYS